MFRAQRAPDNSGAVEEGGGGINAGGAVAQQVVDRG